MWKHIIIQSFIQIVILLILYLLAPTFIGESDLERLAENTIINYCFEEMPGNGDPKNIIYGSESSWSTKAKLNVNIDKNFCGKYASRQSLSVAYKEYHNANGGSVHMTIIFNVFVIYTLFNQINCRIIDDSFNIFKRITRSILFPLITLLEMILQIIIVCFGKSIFHVANNGLTGEQWGYCFGFSAITFIVSIIVKFLKIEKCFKSDDSGNDNNSEISTTLVNSKKTTYDKPIPIDVKRKKEDNDVLPVSENSILTPEGNEDL